jgi:hypothetical protein
MIEVISGMFTTVGAGRSKIFGAECVGKQLRHRAGTGGGIDEQTRTAVLEQDLPAPAARHQYCSACVTHRDGAKAAPTTGDQVTDEYAFGTKTQAV